MNRLKIPIQIMPEGQNLPLPQYATQNSSGMDLYAAIDTDLALEPMKITKVSTGIRIAVPSGYEGQIRPRSGLALKYGITLLNTPGTLDADYRGTICVILINLGQEPFIIHRGDRIAQLVICPINQVDWSLTADLDKTERGGGGFGHTGI